MSESKWAFDVHEDDVENVMLIMTLYENCQPRTQFDIMKFLNERFNMILGLKDD